MRNVGASCATPPLPAIPFPFAFPAKRGHACRASPTVLRARAGILPGRRKLHPGKTPAQRIVLWTMLRPGTRMER